MKKKIIYFFIFLIGVFILFGIFKDTHSYYLDTNNLSLVSSKIGKFGSISKNDLKKNASTQLQDTAVFGLYRYYGTKDTVKNNYICFGTNSKDTCLGDPSTYMYRIIGITDNSTINTDLNIPENSLKIIKASKYSENVAWNSTIDVTWDTAGVNTTVLNITYYDTIFSINNGINWKNKIIDKHYWWIGDVSWAGNSETTATKSTTNKPIGLMYQDDFYNAGSQDINNWLFIQNGWSTNTAEYEWTMSRYDNRRAWVIHYIGGSLYPYSGVYDFYAIRPSFYLIPEISLTGSGADSDPYLIN